MDDIKVSVVIPLYNGADHIMKCIDYLDNQDCDFLYEVLIIDDCSTDDSADLVEKHICDLQHADFYQLIRSPQNGRAGSARNIGIKTAKGHYILFIDQDDYPDSRLLRILWENSCNGKVDMISCAVKDRNGEVYYRPELNADHDLTAEERKQIFRHYGYVFASLVKRNILINNSLFFPEKVMFEDCLYNAGVIVCVKTIQTIKEVLYYREDDENSQTAGFTPKKISDRIKATKNYLQQFQGNEQIREYMPEIKIIAFYYIYLSCMLWMTVMPKLYTKELFALSMSEGKALKISWKDVFDKEPGINKPILLLLRLIYYVPAVFYPVRLIGTTIYKAIKRKKGRIGK